MATVYLAKDSRNGQLVAIKILHERLQSKEKIYERFKQEGILKLQHNNIVKILNAGFYESRAYIVMEYIEGQDLEEFIRQRGNLDINTALNIFTQILSAIFYVHKLGIIHRDIKPKNILITKGGTAKLTDFGIAKSLYSHIKTSTGGYLGAPAYSSPEQMDGKAVNIRSDIYSLGITLYEMLAGKTPYSSVSIEVIVNEKYLGKFIPITSYRKNIPQYLIYIIEKCIAKNQNDRFGSVSQILEMIYKYSSDTLTKTIAISPKKPVNKPVLVLSIVIPILVAIIAIIVIAVRTADRSTNIVETTAAPTTIVLETTVGETTTTETTIKEITTIVTTASEATDTETIAETTTTETIAETTSDTAAAVGYNIGDIGPAGGYIFYVNPNYKTDGWSYLEAAPQDQGFFQWYPGTNVIAGATGATETAIGSGKSNTEKIISVQGQGDYSAWICKNLNINGYADWFLPSKDELSLMYENLYLKGISGNSFGREWYWSSSEVDAMYALNLYFASGGWNGDRKITRRTRVWACRAF